MQSDAVQPDVSVIVPIYNVERYLHQCLASIQSQTWTNIEVICVNDGSTDSSASIAQEFVDADTRFKLLDKPNGGYGQTVNVGLGHAHGRYVSIVEPDDFLDPAMYAKLIACADENPGADVIKASYWEYFDKSSDSDEEKRMPPVMQHLPEQTTVFTLDEYPELFRFHPSIWSAMYRRGFLEENNIRFVEVAGAGWVDNPFFAETLVQAQSIVWVPQCLYYYRQTNEDSSSTLPDPHMPFDRIEEMHKVLTRCHASRDIWAAQYLRDFEYIRIVASQDPARVDDAVVGRIRNTLESMDSDIVRTHPMMYDDVVRFYEDFFTRGEHALDAWRNVSNAELGTILRNGVRVIASHKMIRALRSRFAHKE